MIISESTKTHTVRIAHFKNVVIFRNQRKFRKKYGKLENSGNEKLTEISKIHEKLKIVNFQKSTKISKNCEKSKIDENFEN